MTFLLILVAAFCLWMIGYCILDTANDTWKHGRFDTMNTVHNAFTIVLIVYLIVTWWGPTMQEIWK